MVDTSAEMTRMRGVGLFVFLETILHILWILRWGAISRMSRSSMSRSTSLMTIEKKGAFLAGVSDFFGRLINRHDQHNCVDRDFAVQASHSETGFEIGR